MLDFLSLEFASFLYNIDKGEGGLALNLNRIWNGINEMLQLALDSVNCLNSFCHPLSRVYLCKLWRFPLYIQALASLFLQKRLMRGSDWFVTRAKMASVFFLTKMSTQRRTLSIRLINWSIFSPQGDVYRHFFTLKASNECLHHLYLTQLSL